jgi:enoyl-CoA hydratase/carnithine racemase
VPSTIDIVDVDGVRLITWARPDALNAMSVELWNGTRDAIRTAPESKARVLVVTGTGRAFSVGQDLGEMTDPRQADPDGGFRGLMNALLENELPLIAAVNGMAVGFGATLLPWCDIALAGESARFKVPFISLGVTTEAGSSVGLAELMGPQAAAAFVLTGDWLSASEAAHSGLVWKVVPDDVLLDTTMDLARRIATGPPDSLLTTRRLMTGERRGRIEAAITRENAEFARLAGGPENLAAIERFFNRG